MNVDLYCQLCMQIIQNVEKNCIHFAMALHHGYGHENIVCPHCNSKDGVTLVCYIQDPVDPYARVGFAALSKEGDK